MDNDLDVYKIELELQTEELLKTQAKLSIALEEYTEIFDNAPLSYFILDKKGLIRNVNTMGIEKLGYSKMQLLGKSLSVFINSKEEQDEFYIYRNSLIEGEKRKRFECDMKLFDGSSFYALMEGVVVRDKNDQFKYLLISVSDITGKRLQNCLLESSLNKEKELNEMKSQFITIASHEFRTPLSTILTSTELIEQYNLPEHLEKKKNHFKKIKTSVARIQEILIDFLSADEIEKGKIKNNPEIFDLIDFINTLLAELKMFSVKHSSVFTPDVKSKQVFLDKKLLKLSLSNIIINAYKYSPEGGKVELFFEDGVDDSFCIKIKDEGIGIPQNDKVHLFNKFFRAKNVKNIQGTGIGLNITKKIVKLMGGSLSFISQENKGSTFSICFKNKNIYA